MCEKCIELQQTIYSNKCTNKHVVLNLNSIIEKQEEELEWLRAELKKMKTHVRVQEHDMYQPSMYTIPT